MRMQIEALFGGVLALVVIAVAVYAVANTGITGADRADSASAEAIPIETHADLRPISLASTEDSDLVCECYDKAFSLASETSVLSSDYRTGFEQCRTRAGINGGDAWTAGWEARKHARPYEASCKSYKRKR